MNNDELYSRLGPHGRIDRYESDSNRRAEPRLMVLLKATLHDEGHRYAVVTRDVSRTGVGLITDQPIALGHVVGLDLALPWGEIASRQLEILRCDERTGFYDIAGIFC